MRRNFKATGAILIPLFAFWLSASPGCSSGGGSNPPPQPGQTPAVADFSGTFSGSQQGSQNGTPFAGTLMTTLSQSGNQVTGTFANSGGGRGSVTGTASGNTLPFTTIDSTDTCQYSGTSTLNGNVLTGSITSPGNATCPSLDSTFSITRQAPTPSPAPTVTVTTTPPPIMTCAEVDQMAQSIVDGFMPSSSGRCERDSDCIPLAADKRTEQSGVCVIKCGVATHPQAAEWADFLRTDPELDQTCRQRDTLNCGRRNAGCGPEHPACVNHSCVNRS